MWDAMINDCVCPCVCFCYLIFMTDLWEDVCGDIHDTIGVIYYVFGFGRGWEGRIGMMI